MPAFSTLAVGQALSNLGSDMTGFAITVWAWELTGVVVTVTSLPAVR
jgi:hypothetical protein